MDKHGIKPTTNYMLIKQKEYSTYICHISGNIHDSMDTLKRHLYCHTDQTCKCPRYKYTSLRMDAIRRHSSRHTYKELPRPTMALETKSYQANWSSANSYLYQWTMPKKTETFPWILHELDTIPQRISRPYHMNEPIIMKLNNNFHTQDINQKTM